jgi:hypothetical protein
MEKLPGVVASYGRMRADGFGPVVLLARLGWCRLASAASWAREETASLVKTCDRWV